MKQSENFFSSKRENPCLIIAEIGGNHEGNFKTAKLLAQQALDAGADHVKFQIYRAENIVNREVDYKRYKHFKGFVLSKSDYEKIYKLCNSFRKGSFMASLWDIELFEWYNKLVSIHKVGSGDLTNFPLIKLMVLSGKPIILSTGISDWNLIKKTLNFIYKQDLQYREKKKVALLQCTSLYPCKNHEVNLDSMLYLQKKSGLEVGFSDHTIGTTACEISYSMGGKIIEKHFTDKKKNRRFRDHQVSITKNDLKKLMTKLEVIKTIKGSFDKKITLNEKKNNHDSSFRRSIYAKKKIGIGEKITEQNIVTLRPKLNNC